MFSRMEIGSIAGITIYLDMMFVLVLLFFTYPYFTAGNTQMMSAGLVIIVGLLLSILLHELGHAFAGRLFRAHVSHIELTGLGGIAHFERSLPRSALARSVIYLAGPAVNWGLWQGLGWLAGGAAATGNPMLALPLAPTWSVRIVACLGLAVAVAVALYALPTGIFLLFVALFLAQANWEALQSVGGWSRRR